MCLRFMQLVKSSLRSMEVIKSSRILLPEGLFSGYICVRDGKIVAIEGEFDESTMDLSKVQSGGTVYVQ